MYFHSVLGIKHNASLSDIKRAYAAKIKLHRPDDDPEEFQRIHSAYQSAIDYAKTPYDNYADSDNEDEYGELSDQPANDDGRRFDRNDINQYRLDTDHPAEVLHKANNTELVEASASSGARQQRRFDFKKFSDEFIDTASNKHATLNSWLENHPDLYDIELKQSLSISVLELLNEARPLPPRQLLDLLKFFNLDTVTGMGAEFSHEIENLKNKSANAHPWEDLSFIRPPREQYKNTTESEFPWRIIWYGILVSIFVVRALS
jgi:curved DNA-binding protein CbpA